MNIDEGLIIKGALIVGVCALVLIIMAFMGTGFNIMGG